MEPYNWVIDKENELSEKLEMLKQKFLEESCIIDNELQTVQIIKDYLKKNYVDVAAQRLFEKYTMNIEAYCNWAKVIIDGVEHKPNERIMRRVEESIGISENAKKAFREEILIRMSSYSRRGKKFDYTSHGRLREAIEKSL